MGKLFGIHLELLADAYHAITKNIKMFYMIIKKIKMFYMIIKKIINFHGRIRDKIRGIFSIKKKYKNLPIIGNSWNGNLDKETFLIKLATEK